MKFHCDKRDLYEAVSSVQKTVSSKAILPELEGILVVAKENEITFTGNDMETAIVYTLNGVIDEEGAVIINSKILNEIVRKLPQDQIDISSNKDHKVFIDCKETHFEIKGLHPDGFPAVPKVDKEKSFELGNDLLKEMIKQTIFSISLDEKMPILTGALLKSNEKELIMVTIDGFRMSLKREYILDMKSDIQMVIPGKSLNELYRLIKNEDEKVQVYYEKNQILFDFGHLVFISKLLQGEYINYKSIYPDKYETTIYVNTENITDAIDRANLVIDENKKSPVLFEIKEDVLKVYAKTEIGNVTERITVSEKEGKDISQAFNAKYLLDVLKNIEREDIKISFEGELGPCIIEPTQGDEFSYLILPVRTG